ncbi:hypothetical protein QOZ80_2AG0133210 [Eleusine coracana subsp. coracana]|nr:hypothetical protein QOZ80_2AG0133210 [Eleusine coracana subsp. coracana]
MEAWVGLSADADTLGHICAFELVPGEAVVDQASPSMLSKEKLFCVDPAEKRIGATLVYMGSRSRYCLVQCLSVSDRQEDIWEEFLPERIQYLLRVTTFFLKYDRNGDLHAVVHGQVRSYRLPKSAAHYYDHLEKPVAFWM